MTGFGEAHCQRDGLTVAVELRSINSRYVKISIRCGEGYGMLEPLVEAALRGGIRRGTVQATIRIHRARSAESYELNTAVLDRYRQSLSRWQGLSGISGEIPVANLLLLPGVVDEDINNVADAEADWPLVRETLETAIENLARMRAEEGRAMEADLRANCRAALECVGRIAAQAPQVGESYRARLKERIERIVAEFQVTLAPGDLIREVGLFAERCDVSEEIVRLRSHCEQFEASLSLPESSGRKLDFLTQEMLRETNTIGSKANDVQIAREVIEIKSVLERIREMIQNVE
ncbi:MAG: YicC family protein [Pirellulales bacterium]|nr:YicC family protein [Pirellulales bacterium]